MKKLIALTFALIITFSFIACKGSSKPANNAGNANAQDDTIITNNEPKTVITNNEQPKEETVLI